MESHEAPYVSGMSVLYDKSSFVTAKRFPMPHLRFRAVSVDTPAG